MRSAELAPETGPSKYLYLAQLSTSLESIKHYTKGVEMLEAGLPELEGEEKEEVERAIAAALCGMAELYLTDLWYDFETRCLYSFIE